MSAKDSSKPAEGNIDLDRRNFLFGAFRRRKDDEDTAPPQAVTDQAYAVLRRANEAFEAGQWEPALELYNEFLQTESKNNEARIRKGRCLYRLERYIQAKVEFERVLRMRRQDNESALHLGLTLARLDKPDKAAVIWQQVFDPDRPVIQRELNLQLLYLENDQMAPPPAKEMADAVELAMAEQRRQDKAGRPGLDG